MKTTALVILVVAVFSLCFVTPGFTLTPLSTSTSTPTPTPMPTPTPESATVILPNCFQITFPISRPGYPG